MKKALNIIFIAVGILVLALFGVRTYTKSHSPFEKVEITDDDLKVSVGYCRPYLNGRKIFGELVPYNTIWRTGANEATVISFSKSCNFGGKRVKAGEYSLWTIPTKNDWTIILNSESGQWGTNYEEAKDYVRVSVKSIKSTESLDQLTLKLTKYVDKGIDFSIAWENTVVHVPIQ